MHRVYEPHEIKSVIEDLLSFLYKMSLPCTVGLLILLMLDIILAYEYDQVIMEVHARYHLFSFTLKRLGKINLRVK